MSYIYKILGCMESALVVWAVFGVSIGLMYLYHEKLLKKDGLTLVSWQKVLCRLTVALPVVLMVAFRSYETGADTANMWNGYLACETMTFWEAVTYEPTAFVFYTARWLVYHLTGGSMQIYFLLIALPTLYFVVAGIEKWGLKYNATALFVFYSCFGLNLIDQARQMISVALLFYAYYYAFHGQWKKYIPFVIAAGLLHLSALFCGVLIYLMQPREEKSWKNKLTLIVLAVSVFAMGPMLKLAGELVRGTMYYAYIERVSFKGFGLGFFITLIPTVVPALLFQNKLDKERRMRNTMLVVAFMRYAAYYSFFLYRLFYYFGSVNVIALPLVLERSSEKNRKLVWVITIGLCVGYFLLNFCASYAEVYFPYRPFWA